MFTYTNTLRGKKAFMTEQPDNHNIYTHFHARFKHGGTFIQGTNGQARHTYIDLHHRSAKYANLLTNLDLQAGDRIIVQVDKSAECLFLYFACLRAGLVYLPLNSAYGQDEVTYFVGNAEPALIVCTPAALASFEQITTPTSCQLLTLDASGHGSLVQALAAGDFSEKFQSPPTNADDVAVILYTSGTTGQPKGAMVTHGNLLTNTQALHQVWHWQSDDILLHSLPIFHIHGLFVATHLAVFNASPIILLTSFNPAEVIELLPKATVFMGVPTHYVRLLKHGGLSHQSCQQMRLFTSGSAPLLRQTFDAFEAASGHRIVERYGMTETGITTSNPFDGYRKPGTVGPSLPGIESRIVADDVDLTDNPDHLGRQQVANGTTGNLQIRGPNVFKGYWRMIDKTQEEFTADGFFNTGDLAQRDNDGYIAIVGRSKDMIISGGLNVYPKEIETVIDKLPGVVESAVIGIFDSDFGEAVTAVINTAPDTTLTEAQVIAFMKLHLANFKIAKQVYFVTELPRNAMGKIQKNRLREQFSKT
ncbi:MAG: malonyl-CoA/methylmalonyl-CoA synthetase [Candidatus Azotimanducaceae bacterium]|jgi:malonyl-CoA/methylmalonyl-CoA synthetase